MEHRKGLSIGKRTILLSLGESVNCSSVMESRNRETVESLKMCMPSVKRG